MKELEVIKEEILKLMKEQPDKKELIIGTLANLVLDDYKQLIEEFDNLDGQLLIVESFEDVNVEVRDSIKKRMDELANILF